jgi:hypothetical protein
MTRAIPFGTVNLTVNVTEDEAAIWTRLGGVAGRSALIRNLLLEGASTVAPAIAAEVRAVRSKYGRHVASVTMLAVGILSIGLSILHNEPLRKAKAGSRVVKVTKGKRGNDSEA